MASTLPPELVASHAKPIMEKAILCMGWTIK